MTMRNELISARTFLRKYFPHGGKVLCAVSGGLDSMCLLDFLCRQKGLSVTAAHFNHQLRGGTADRDEAFVRSFCADRGIAFVSGAGDTRALAAREGRTIEEAARILRYDFLKETAKNGGFDAVFTAHHARDNAETMLLNLIRGTGSAGLRGMREARPLGAGPDAPRLLRPFLTLPPETLADYAAGHAIPHVEDESNGSDVPARNRLRHQVLPVLEGINPRAVENMTRAAETLRREDEALETLARRLAERHAAALPEGGVRMEAGILEELPAALAERTALRLLAAAAGGRKDLSSAHISTLLTLPEGGTANLPYGLTVQRRNGILTLTRREGPLPRAELRLNTPLRWGDYTLTLRDRPVGEGLPLRPGTEPLSVAPLTGAERLTLPGTRGGSRTVKRLCQDRGLDLAARQRLPGIFLGERLAAVWPLGTDAAFLPAGDACRFVTVESETE